MNDGFRFLDLESDTGRENDDVNTGRDFLVELQADLPLDAVDQIERVGEQPLGFRHGRHGQDRRAEGERRRKTRHHLVAQRGTAITQGVAILGLVVHRDVMVHGRPIAEILVGHDLDAILEHVLRDRRIGDIVNVAERAGDFQPTILKAQVGIGGHDGGVTLQTQFLQVQGRPLRDQGDDRVTETTGALVHGLVAGDEGGLDIVLHHVVRDTHFRDHLVGVQLHLLGGRLRTGRRFGVGIEHAVNGGGVKRNGARSGAQDALAETDLVDVALREAHRHDSRRIQNGGRLDQLADEGVGLLRVHQAAFASAGKVRECQIGFGEKFFVGHRIIPSVKTR